jgi:hypothetical protein
MDNNGAPQEFFEEVAEKLEGIKAIVKKYGLEDQWTSAFVGGVYSETIEGEVKLKTVLDYVVVDAKELEEIVSLLEAYYEEMDKGLTMPTDVEDTSDWTHEDWMKFINDNTDRDGAAN